MILIADSGSTKTDWRLVNRQDKAKKIKTTGFNPHFIDVSGIQAALKKELLLFINKSEVSAIYYYGAGCSLRQKAAIVRKALQNTFSNAKVFVHTDLLGAARALFGKGEGIACILGTGSNSCYYDGKKIVENIPSLGYMFGDEGSGAHMGKVLINDYLKDEMPKDIRAAFDKRYKLTHAKILTALYNKPYPNRFLASFTKFLSENNEHLYAKQVQQYSFRAFFHYHIRKYPDYEYVPFACVGSIAYHFNDMLKQVADENGMCINKTLLSPIDELVAYHLDA